MVIVNSQLAAASRYHALAVFRFDSGVVVVMVSVVCCLRVTCQLKVVPSEKYSKHCVFNMIVPFVPFVV